MNNSNLQRFIQKYRCGVFENVRWYYKDGVLSVSETADDKGIWVDVKFKCGEEQLPAEINIGDSTLLLRMLKAHDAEFPIRVDENGQLLLGKEDEGIRFYYCLEKYYSKKRPFLNHIRKWDYDEVIERARLLKQVRCVSYLFDTATSDNPNDKPGSEAIKKSCFDFKPVKSEPTLFQFGAYPLMSILRA